MTNNLKYIEDFTTKQVILPLNIGVNLEKDSEVFTYLELMKGIKLESYFEKRSPQGRNRRNRVSIIHVILFGFMMNIRSTRSIESACKNDIRFMYLLGDTTPPTHSTINNVMREIGDKLEYLKLEINKEIMKREIIDIDYLYIDGTKIEADSNKYTFVWKKSVIKNRDKLYHKVTKLLSSLNEILSQNGYTTIEGKEKYTSKQLMKMTNRLIGIIDKQGITLVYGKGKRKTPIQRVYEELSKYSNKLSEYETHLSIIGPNRNSYAKTDHDATFMHMKEDHMRNAQLKPGYNIQIGVSNEYIMVSEIFQNGTDQLTFEPLLEKYNILYDRYPKYPVADAGYGSYDNYTYCTEKGMELYQKYSMWAKEKTRKHQKNIFHQDNLKEDKDGNYICPNNKKFINKGDYQSKYIRHEHTKTLYECESCERCPLKSKCTTAKGNRTLAVLNGLKEYKEKVRENLSSPLGIELRIQRSIQVEGAFGIIKEDMKFRRFSRIMFSGVKLEFNLIVIGYNLKKFHNKLYR